MAPNKALGASAKLSISLHVLNVDILFALNNWGVFTNEITNILLVSVYVSQMTAFYYFKINKNENEAPFMKQVSWNIFIWNGNLSKNLFGFIKILKSWRFLNHNKLSFEIKWKLVFVVYKLK